ncbi:hypothetical protein HUG10_07455 [Halorarum halophilum]|uniref:YD repeat-containing protein n=1 Tax=Halorarum halophilum TaxID=2743090 RepID=A0A7D5GZC5_9EURY|nr:hypothetical protein [Halobaculum halophilum]QLG27393.1 hypothetical protein HUG10_07455 [Halobaculum halophilum]
MTDCGFTIEYTDPLGERRRVRYEPRTPKDSYLRYVEAHTGRVWRTEGCEPVRDLVIEDDCTGGR